jgi:predicted aminopeptidase
MTGAASAAARVGPWAWGAAIAFAVTHHYFGYTPGRMHMNDESYSYVWRSVEFIDALAAGYWSPQWATHFRAGLGSPYFGYYQPGFFYVVAAFASVLPVFRALAATVWTFAFLGYAGVFSLVRGRFGTGPAMLAGTMLLLAAYVRSDLYVRGDLSEYAGTMMLAAALAALVGWLEDGGRWRWTALALSAGATVVLHPVAGLVGYATLGLTLLVWAIATRSLRRPIGAGMALVAGVGLSAFYWLPLWLEWDAVQGDNPRVFDVLKFFVPPSTFVVGDPGFRQLKTGLGAPALSLPLVASALLAWRWRELEPAQRRLAATCWVLGAVSTVMMTSVSSPIWASSALLGLVQFPWRLLLVQSIALAALAGCLPRVPVAVPIAVAAVAAVLAAPRLAETPYPVWDYQHFATAPEIEQRLFKPDAANEWMPVGARPLAPAAPRPQARADGGFVTDFERCTGHLSARVIRKGATAIVTLPHYAFPLGWHATIAGEPIPIEGDPNGFMVLRVSRNGRLDVRYTTTPARRAGLWMGAATLAVLAAGLALGGRRHAAVATMLLVAVVGSGCGRAGYLLHGGLAEARILMRREPIADLLARPDLDAEVRTRLTLVLAVRRYADERLGLNVGDSYSTFADVGAEPPVWVLSAAHRDRLAPYTWWYPIVGRVPYQGYFERDEANRAAAALADRGFDVDVRAASAFSTLGWFADPVLSTTLKAAPVVVVETVLHELFHATLYVPSQVPFNESAATFVGHRGAIAFFCDGAHADAGRCAEARHRWDVVKAHARVLERYVRRLQAVYAGPLDPVARQRARARLAERVGRALARRGLAGREEIVPPNNARLLAMLAYETELPAFERLAPTSAALPDAIGRIVRAARGAPDPFAAVGALDANPLQMEPTGLDSGEPWPSSLSPWTRCSGGSRAGSGSSGTTWPTVRTCTGGGSPTAPVAIGG